MLDRLSLGQRVNIGQGLALRVGIRTEAVDISGGLSLKIDKFFFDYGYSDNAYLGGTHRIGLRFIK